MVLWKDLSQERKEEVIEEVCIRYFIKKQEIKFISNVFSNLIKDNFRISYYQIRRILRKNKKNYLPIKKDKVTEFLEKQEKKKSLQEEKNELVQAASQKEFLDQMRACLPTIIVSNKIEIVPPIIDKTKDDESIVLQISDIHLGQYFKSSEAGNLGAYSKDIFLERMETYKKAVFKLADIISSYSNIDNIYLLYLGDVTEGNGQIFKNQPFILDLMVSEQILYFAKAFSEFETLLYSKIPCKKIITVGITGNHGNVSGGKGHHPILNNMDYLSYHMKNMMRNNILLSSNISSKNKEIVDHIPESNFQLLNIKDYNFLLVHGDNIKSVLQLPFYGLDRANAMYTRLLKQKIDYMLTAHFHAASELPVGVNSMIITNGSFVGTNLYSSQILKAGNSPTQNMFTIHKNFGITGRWTISLDRDYSEKYSPKII